MRIANPKAILGGLHSGFHTFLLVHITGENRRLSANVAHVIILGNNLNLFVIVRHVLEVGDPFSLYVIRAHSQLVSQLLFCDLTDG